jgi:hypothetical protein
MNLFFNFNFNVFHHLLQYCDLSSENIQSVVYCNYDDFQYANFIFFTIILFHYFEDNLMMKLTNLLSLHRRHGELLGNSWEPLANVATTPGILPHSHLC